MALLVILDYHIAEYSLSRDNHKIHNLIHVYNGQLMSLYSIKYRYRSPVHFLREHLFSFNYDPIDFNEGNFNFFSTCESS